MLVNMKDMLAKAAREGYGVGNFDVFNTELLKGVMEAAEEAAAPVILAYSPPFEKYSPKASSIIFADCSGILKLRFSVSWNSPKPFPKQ